ncbi:MAG: hypothetical protein WBN78_07250 [Gammaproteobacteria bacterium]
MKTTKPYLQIMVLGVAIALAGCSSTRPTDQRLKRTVTTVSPGDRVQVTTLGGQKLQLTVEKADDEVLIGRRDRSDSGGSIGTEIRLPFDQIALIRLRDTEGSSAAALPPIEVVAGVGIGAAVVVGLLVIGLAGLAPAGACC